MISSSSSATPTSPTSSSQETGTPTEHPASTRSGRTSEEVPVAWTSEIENPNKNHVNREVRWNLSHDLPEWLQGHGLVDESVPEHRDASSSSHELPLEPRAKAVSGSGTQSAFTHFPQDRNCEICRWTKITRAPCRKRTGEAVPPAEKSVTWQQITDVNLGTIIDTLSWCRTWPPNGSSRIRAKQKLLRKRRRACKSSWSRIGSLKSFTLTIFGIWLGL